MTIVVAALAVISGVVVAVPLAGAEVHGPRQEVGVEVRVRVIRVVGVSDGIASVGVVEVVDADGVPAAHPHHRPRQEGGDSKYGSPGFQDILSANYR